MPILRVLLTIAISVSALFAQVAENDSYLLPGVPQGSADSFAFSLSAPAKHSSGLFQDWPMSSATESRFSLKALSPLKREPVMIAGFNLDPAELPPQSSQAPPAQPTARRPKAFTYSDGYILRNKIHKYASIATLPLFAAEAIVGQKLYDDRESESWRSAHSALGYGIVGLFSANSVTGIWNLWEARKNPNGRGKRMFHGMLMLGANIGFLATMATAPDDDHNEGVEEHETGDSGGSRSLHRNVAIASMGVAAIGYIYMWFAK